MSLFDLGWLFSGSQKKNDVPVTVTAEDYEAWLNHLAKRHPLSRRPGLSIKDEYEQFVTARARNRPVAPPNDQLA
jgi:hypothetical protein